MCLSREAIVALRIRIFQYTRHIIRVLIVEQLRRLGWSLNLLCFVVMLFRDVRASSILLDDKYEVRIGSLSDSRTQDSESHSSILSRMFGFSR